MKKKVFLIAVYIICIANMVFFTDVIVNHVIGNEVSMLSGASTGDVQCYISIVVDFMCLVIVYFYTKALEWE